MSSIIIILLNCALFFPLFDHGHKIHSLFSYLFIYLFIYFPFSLEDLELGRPKEQFYLILKFNNNNNNSNTINNNNNNTINIDNNSYYNDYDDDNNNNNNNMWPIGFHFNFVILPCV
jgi:hypothetical protein